MVVDGLASVLKRGAVPQLGRRPLLWLGSVILDGLFAWRFEQSLQVEVYLLLVGPSELLLGLRPRAQRVCQCFHVLWLRDNNIASAHLLFGPLSAPVSFFVTGVAPPFVVVDRQFRIAEDQLLRHFEVPIRYLVLTIDKGRLALLVSVHALALCRDLLALL